jgi:hypothetical protein
MATRGYCGIPLAPQGYSCHHFLATLRPYPLWMANVETKIQQEIRLGLGTREDVRLFRNQVGQLPDPRTGRPVQFGLAKGSADLVGWKTVTITPDMVGQEVAVFASIEVKTPTGRPTQYQQAWLSAVEKAGGIAGIARSVDDALRIVE